MYYERDLVAEYRAKHPLGDIDETTYGARKIDSLVRQRRRSLITKSEYRYQVRLIEKQLFKFK